MEDRQVKELDLDDCLKSISKLFWPGSLTEPCTILTLRLKSETSNTRITFSLLPQIF